MCSARMERQCARQKSRKKSNAGVCITRVITRLLLQGKSTRGYASIPSFSCGLKTAFGYVDRRERLLGTEVRGGDVAMPMDVMDIIEAMKNVAVACAAVFGIYLGCRGLRTWREELSGRAKYKTARQILRAVYQLRNGIWLVRASGIREDEIHAAQTHCTVVGSKRLIESRTRSSVGCGG
jgi:hypothetical protein